MRARVVSWSPGGKLVASGDDNGSVQIWDASAGGRLFAHQHHSQAIYALEWSPDGQLLASTGEDGALCVVRVRAVD